MPRKGKRRSKSSKVNMTAAQANPVMCKTLDSYFPPSPPEENGNNSICDRRVTNTPSLEHCAAEESRSQESVLITLPTPEDSPEKKDLICLQSAVGNRDTVGGPDVTLMEPNIQHSTDGTIPAAICKTNALPTRMKTEKVNTNHTLNEYFQVRKSTRKTAKALLREQEKVLRDKILRHCEEGLEVVEYPGKGRGVEATIPICKGEFVVEYAGDLIELKEAKSRENEYKKDVTVGCYMYFFNHKERSYCIDATLESGRLGRLLNHSKTKANCMTRTVEIDNRPYLILVASRDIAQGEELLYDYGDRSKEAIQSHPWLKD